MAESRTAAKKTKKLYDEVLELLLERDRMTYFDSKALQLRYNEATEGLSLKLQRLQIDMIKLQYVLAAVQEGTDRGEAERRADEELLQDELFYEMQRQLKNPRDLLSEDECEELDEIYSELLTILNPDLNPCQTLDTASLFISASSAYEYCRKDDLRAILDEARKFKTPDYEAMSDSEHAQRQKDLKTARGQIRTMIEEIEDEFPFDKEEILDDEDELAAEKERLLKSVETVGDMIETCRRMLEEA